MTRICLISTSTKYKIDIMYFRYCYAVRVKSGGLQWRGHCSVVSGLPCSAADLWFPGCSPATGGSRGQGSQPSAPRSIGDDYCDPSFSYIYYLRVDNYVFSNKKTVDNVLMVIYSCPKHPVFCYKVSILALTVEMEAHCRGGTKD